ncbi:MAG: hypothetical protein L0Y67_03500 [Gammaproteobacteria bacterium]|nr:hypothetical protein [Gammaproteobacteria bacterium]MCI0590659.1 hypothetical protein [Gammaproteobacteria bacterium]
MISLLRSRFDFLGGRVFFLGSGKLTVFHWHKGGLSNSYVFDATNEGLFHYSRYLQEVPDVPVCILVDVVEEEFRRETMPHVYLADRRTLISRKKSRLFRDSPYVCALMQGRESEGRRDDRVLFTALMNQEILRPWLEPLPEHKVPLAGIYSVPILSELLLKWLPSSSTYSLVVSLQRTSGLRQSFFLNQQLKISRLATMKRAGEVPDASYILEEVEKIHKYLNSLRLTLPDEALDIYLLSHGRLLSDLRMQCSNSALIRYHLMDVNEVGRRMGMKRALSSTFCEPLFAHLLLKSPPKHNYATSTQTPYYQLHRVRNGMLVGSLLLILGSALWSGFTLMEGIGFRQRSIAAEQKANFYEARYQIARERLKETPVPPTEIRVAVDLVDTIDQYKTSPVDMMTVISKGLTGFPSIQVDKLQWATSTDPNYEFGNVRPGEVPNRSGATTPTPATNIPYRFFQIALVAGYLEPFDGNYRAALATINEYAETLRSMKSVYHVDVVTLPLDTSSDARLQGTAGVDKGEAKFSIRIVVGMGNEAG